MVCIRWIPLEEKVKEQQSNELLEQCLNHSLRYCSNKIKDKVVMLVHPFMPKNTVYEDNMNLVISNARSLEWSLIYCTYPLIYNHSIVEQGLFDQVLFTNYRRGALINGYEELNRKKLLITGCYGDLCVRAMIYNLIENTDSEINLMPEALLFSINRPQGLKLSNQELIKNLIDESAFEREIRIITLEEFLNP